MEDGANTNEEKTKTGAAGRIHRHRTLP